MYKRTELVFVKDKLWIYRESESFTTSIRHKPEPGKWTPLIIRRKANVDSFRYYRTKSPRTTHARKQGGFYYFKRGRVKLPSLKKREQFIHPNNFVFHKEVGLGAGSYGTGMWAKSYALGRDDSFTSSWSARKAAVSTAYSRFVDLARGDGASLGETFGEIGQSIDMIEARSRQLALAWKSLRAGRFKEVYRSLNLDASGLNRHPGADVRARAKQRAGDIGGAFLEYWFGWSPLVNDVRLAVGVLTGQTPLSKDRVIGRATTKDAYHSVTKPYGTYTSVETGACTVRVRIQARVSVTSQPRLLASQLGLNNPVLTAWNLLRMSFLVDWFVNVSQFLDSYNWLDGFSLTDAFHTVSYEGADRYTVGGDDIVNEKFFRVRRAVGMPAMPLPTLRIPARLSPARAAVATSLLAQQFASVHTDTTHFGAKHLK